MAGKDVEAGKAYVTFYLRRVGFDQQIDQVKRDTQQAETAKPKRTLGGALAAYAQPWKNRSDFEEQPTPQP